MPTRPSGENNTKATKVSPNAVYKWLQGKRIPNFRCAVILAQVLGVSVEWLAGGE